MRLLFAASLPMAQDLTATGADFLPCSIGGLCPGPVDTRTGRGQVFLLSIPARKLAQGYPCKPDATRLIAPQSQSSGPRCPCPA